jgi:hypothetical protein
MNYFILPIRMSNRDGYFSNTPEPVEYQYTSAGSYSLIIPTGYKYCDILIRAGGGGAGSAGVANTNATGGASGNSGGTSIMTFPLSQLPSGITSFFITVGAGGTGGASVVNPSVATPGNNGTAGSETNIRFNNSIGEKLIVALGGALGVAGTVSGTAPVPANSSGWGVFQGLASQAPSLTSQPVGSYFDGNRSPGGSAGGSLNASGVQVAPGVGPFPIVVGNSVSPPTAEGANGLSFPYNGPLIYPGRNTTGGRASTTSHGGHGADATGYGGSGSGGGACKIGFTSGKGGNGRNGVAYLKFYN